MGARPCRGTQAPCLSQRRGYRLQDHRRRCLAGPQVQRRGQDRYPPPVPAGPHHVDQHRRGVPGDPKGPAGHLRPVHGNLGDSVTHRPRKREDLDVEAETRGPRQAEEQLRLGMPKRLEATLGVGDVQSREGPGDSVERPATHPPAARA